MGPFLKACAWHVGKGKLWNTFDKHGQRANHGILALHGTQRECLCEKRKYEGMREGGDNKGGLVQNGVGGVAGMGGVLFVPYMDIWGGTPPRYGWGELCRGVVYVLLQTSLGPQEASPANQGKKRPA